MDSTATIALRISPEDFVRFLENADMLDLRKRGSSRLTGADIIDHAATNDTSVYFVDPRENSLELIPQCAGAVTEHFGEGQQLYTESSEVQT